MGPLPIGEHRQQIHRISLVADEVVVNQENLASPAQSIQQFKLVHHLIRGLGAGHATIELGDVAEFTVGNGHPRENCTPIMS